jgi:hypothetical protein
MFNEGKFNEALEKEKEQIINAYNQADLDGYLQKTYPKYAEEYYNKTYNQNQNNQKYDGVKLKTFIRDEADFQMPEKEIEARNIIQDLKDRYEKD